MSSTDAQMFKVHLEIYSTLITQQHQFVAICIAILQHKASKCQGL